MPNNILDELQESSLLTISLQGVRSLLEREFGLKNLTISTDDMFMQWLAAQAKSQGPLQYPYAYLSMSELTSVRDRVNNKAISRAGIKTGLNKTTYSTTRKAYTFPISLAMSLKYIDSDVARVIKMSEALIILAQIGPLGFTMEIDQLELDVTVMLPSSCSINLAETDKQQCPGAFEIEASLVINTWTGFFKQTSAVSSNKPIINIQTTSSYLQNLVG